MNVQDYMTELGQNARMSARALAGAATGQKNQALLAMAKSLLSNQARLLAANEKDLQAAKEAALEPAMIDRLVVDQSVIESMAEGLRQVAALPDPCGEISDMCFRPSGIQVGKMRVPLGVVGIIYESRPNVTIDAASLCLKSGNATILRGGSEALHSNQAIAECIREGLQTAGLPEASVQVVTTPDRQAVAELITMAEYVDVIIPRGGKGLIERISRDAKVAVIKHLDGICHVYIDEYADLDKAFDIALNAKTHRYGVCNAMETLLVHKAVAEKVLPRLARAYWEKNVQLRCCESSLKVLSALSHDHALLSRAEAVDWDTEYLAPTLAVKVVADMASAMGHIAEHSSGHTESIVSQDYSRVQQFLSQVDSSSVIANASTRFADGFEYGLGAEIGISTDKIHARGPVGLEGLTSQKWIVYGDGHIRN